MSSAVRAAQRRRRALPALLAPLAPLAPLAFLVLAAGGASPLAAQSSTQTPARPPTNPLAVPSRTPPVRVTLSEEELVPGDRVRVLVRPRADGYVVVLHADPAGRVRVLFPLDPGDSQRMPGAMQRSIPSRDGSASFIVASTTGDGAVIAAVASSPFRVSAFASGGHWNVRAFPRLARDADPEGELVAVVRRMAGGTRFDYASAPYRVTEGLPVVAYNGGYGGGYEQEREASATPASADGYYDYYGDYYDPYYYAGPFPGLLWYGVNSPCVVHHGRGAAMRPGCGGFGRYSHRASRPWGGAPVRRNAAAGTLAFPGNPSFGDPPPYGHRAFAPRAIEAPGVVPGASGGGGRPGAPAGGGAPSGGLMGVPARPLPGVAGPRPSAAPAPRPSTPRMP